MVFHSGFHTASRRLPRLPEKTQHFSTSHLDSNLIFAASPLLIGLCNQALAGPVQCTKVRGCQDLLAATSLHFGAPESAPSQRTPDCHEARSTLASSSPHRPQAAMDLRWSQTLGLPSLHLVQLCITYVPAHGPHENESWSDAEWLTSDLSYMPFSNPGSG